MNTDKENSLARYDKTILCLCIVMNILVCISDTLLWKKSSGKFTKIQLGDESFVQQTYVSDNLFVRYVIKLAIMDKIDIISDSWQKIWLTNIFAQRIFCVTKFCPVSYHGNLYFDTLRIESTKRLKIKKSNIFTPLKAHK